MDLRQVRAAIAVADHRHFGRAASTLGMTQPALSQTIKHLETHLGIALFDRDTRHVTITAAADQFVAETRSALSLLEAATTRAQAAGRGEAGTLAIGMVGSAMLVPIPRLLRTFRDHYPEVRVSFAELTTAGQVEQLRAGELDIGFLRPPLPTPANTEFELSTVAREPVLAALPADHRLAQRQHVPLKALANEPFVRTPRHLGAGFYDQITTLCREAGFEPHVAQEAVRMDTITGLVAAGFGVSIVPGSVTRRPTPDVVFAHLSPAPNPIELALARPTRHSSPLVTNFVALARDLTHV